MSIRPFRLPDDLGVMSRLVAAGFQYPENPSWSVQPDDSQAMVDQINSARRLWPVLSVGRRFIPLLRDVLCGFIDEQDGEPAGLINYMRPHDEPDWYVANVTVLPAYRRRGIARRLVEATLEELHRRGARVVVLDVVEGNDPAVKLYLDLGFEPFAQTVEFQLPAGASIDPQPLPVGYRLLRVSRFDWQTAFGFARRVTPERVGRYEAVTEARFRTPRSMLLMTSLFEWFAGARGGRFALESSDGLVVAVGQFSYRTRAGGRNRVQLSIDPDHPDLAEFMLRHALSLTSSHSLGHRTELTFDGWQGALIARAESMGCERRWTMHRMGLRLPA